MRGHGSQYTNICSVCKWLDRPRLFRWIGGIYRYRYIAAGDESGRPVEWQDQPWPYSCERRCQTTPLPSPPHTYALGRSATKVSSQATTYAVLTWTFPSER